MNNDGVFQQEPDGRWVPAEPIGWLEEHNKFWVFIYWVLGWKHCCAQEGDKLPRFWRRS